MNQSQKNSDRFCADLGIELPIIGGAMYPCSNPELVAAVSDAGGIGVIQPLSLTYVHGYDFREGIHYIRSLTNKPIGLNLLVEKSSDRYIRRLNEWLAIALEEGVRFFVTALGNPKPAVDKIHAAGGIVYHNTTARKWAEKALAAGVDGLICVNNRAGGHAGTESAEQLYQSLSGLGKPLIAAGGIADPVAVKQMIDLGYAGVQMGTRFLSSQECSAHADYKQAIVDATEADIVLTDKLSGVPVSVINSPFIQRVGAKAGPLARWLLRGPRTKRYMRMYYTIRSFRTLKSDKDKTGDYQHYLQAGKSVGQIGRVQPVAEIMAAYRDILRQ